MKDARPDFVVIGAMKSATTTLHCQLARQAGVFMSPTKEPNFFSDDEVYSRGLAWYTSLFRGAAPGDARGASRAPTTRNGRRTPAPRSAWPAHCPT